MNTFRSLPAPESARILLGDANVSIRDLSAALLYRADQPASAGSGAETYRESLQEKGCNLLVIDYKIPGHSGLRLIVKMRAAHMTSPVVMTSITIDADELSRNSRFTFATAETRTFTAKKLLELADAVLQIVGTAPVEAPSPALIESIERRLLSITPLKLPIRWDETGRDLISSPIA